MNFQDDLFDYIEDAIEGGCITYVPVKERLADFDKEFSNANLVFTKVANLVRSDSIEFADIHKVLVRGVEPRVVELTNRMNVLISMAQKDLEIETSDRDSLERFKHTIERLYKSLVTMTQKDPSLVESVNLLSTLRKLHTSAIGKNKEAAIPLLPAPRNIAPPSKLKPTVVTNREQITSVLQNLMLNALRFASQHESGEVMYYWEPTLTGLLPPGQGDRHNAEWITFHILNRGPRIPSDFENTMFEYGAKSGSQDHPRFGGGSGVGLTIARLLAADNGGTVFYNKSQEGLTDFCVQLPLDPATGLSFDEGFSQLPNIRE